MAARGLIALGAAMALTGCASAADGAAATSAGAGIKGRVLAGPTCPVERYPPDPRCALRPLVVSLRIVRVTGRFSKVVESGADGRFRIRLAPAIYEIQPLRRDGSALPRPPESSRVRVRPGRFTQVRIVYDTGIR